MLTQARPCHRRIASAISFGGRDPSLTTIVKALQHSNSIVVRAAGCAVPDSTVTTYLEERNDKYVRPHGILFPARNHYGCISNPSLCGTVVFDGLPSPWCLLPRRHFALWGGRTRGPESAAEEGGREELARLEIEVLEVLSTVCESCTGKNVVELGLVQELFVNHIGKCRLHCVTRK